MSNRDKISKLNRENKRRENTDYEVFRGKTPWGKVNDGCLIIKRDPELSYVKSWRLTEDQARRLGDDLLSLHGGSERDGDSSE